MTTAQIRQLGRTVGLVISLNRSAVISLLNGSGSQVSDQISNSDLVAITIDQVIENPAFNKGFSKLTKAESEIFRNATGLDSFASAEGGFDWGGFGAGLIGAGTSIFGSIQATNAQKKLAEQEAKIAQLNSQTAITQAQAQLEIERLRLQQIEAQNAGGTGNTMLYVGIGLVGILVIGGVIFAVKK